MLNCMNMAKLSIASLLLLAGACSDDNKSQEPENKPGAGEHTEEAAATAGNMVEDASEAIAEGIENAANSVGDAVENELNEINALGLTVRNILDEEVYTQAGGVAAHIDDILFDESGRPALAVLKEGGFFGVGEDTIIVTVQRLTIAEESDGELSVGITLSEKEIEELGDGVGYLPADFSVGGEVDATLISGRKLLDTVVYNSEDEKVADIFDLLLGLNWQIDRVVVSSGGLGDIADRLTAVPWNMFALSEERDSMKTTPAVTDFDTLPPFDYRSLVK